MTNTTVCDEDGIALMTMISLLLVLSVLSAALLLSSSTEARIAASFQAGLEGRHAADAAAERALVDLASTADWNGALDGSVRSSFIDGPASGPRSFAGRQFDLDEERHLLNCGRRAACTDAELDAVTAERPWGSNNPRWQLYAHGPLARLSTRGSTSRLYIAVWVADDPSETDGSPARDAAGPADPGHGVVLVRAEAFGPGGSRRAVLLRVTRDAGGGAGRPSPVRVVSWRRVL
jgi:hypothetical protein